MAAASSLDQHFGILYTLRDGKIVRMEWFNSPEEALEAAGLSGQDAHADS